MWSNCQNFLLFFCWFYRWIALLFVNYDSPVFCLPIFIALTFVYLIAIPKSVQCGVVAGRTDLCALLFCSVDVSNIFTIELKFSLNFWSILIIQICSACLLGIGLEYYRVIFQPLFDNCLFFKKIWQSNKFTATFFFFLFSSVKCIYRPCVNPTRSQHVAVTLQNTLFKSVTSMFINAVSIYNASFCSQICPLTLAS